ncbi:MAG: M10 family metallopeptidase C-terminal domain-containing protein [Rhizomicrobium sp.]
MNAAHVIVPTSFATWNTDPTPTNPATYNAVSSAAKWGAGAAGTAGGTVTYFFDAASAWSPTEQAVFVAAYALWSDVANIQFAPAADAASANILIRRGAPGSGAFFSGGLTGSGGAGTVGTTNIWHFQSTGAFINLATADTSFGPVTADPNVAGGHVWSTIVHEEGHSLGLGHGGPYNGDVDPATQQFSAQDTTLWTIMSYIDPGTTTAKYFAEYPVTGTNWGTSADFFARSAETPMMLDIQAAQQLYGAPTVTAYSGGQVFGFNCNITDASKPFFDFTVNTNPVVTIWDAGANNALDLSGFSAASNVNLNAGTFSSCDGMVNNIAIAAGTAINAFVGGPGNDTVLGNDNGDLITSGAGNDALTGGAGNDGFFFGAFYTAGDTVNGGGGTNNQIGLLGDYSAGITLSGAQIGNIQVLALQPGFNYVLTLTDDLVSTGTFSVWSVSMTSANSVNVNASAETSVNYSFFMGQGNDTVAAGSGNDLIYGEGGKDTLRGGPGNDTFAYLAVATGGDGQEYRAGDGRAGADVFPAWSPMAS